MKSVVEMKIEIATKIAAAYVRGRAQTSAFELSVNEISEVSYKVAESILEKCLKRGEPEVDW